MNLLLLYLLLTKATLTFFSGPTSLPIIRQDFVEHRHILTDRQLNAAMAAGRTAPGPTGLWVVSVGYFVAGTPGGAVGFLAMITPAFLIIPILQFLGRWVDRSEVKSAVRAVMFAASGLMIGTTIPLARDSLAGALPVAIAIGSFFFLLFTKRATIWVIGAAALIGLAGALL
jgi:chromate transporter